MALDYANLFGNLGKLIKHYLAFYTSAQGIAAIGDELSDEFNDENTEAAIAGLRPDTENSWRSSYVGRRATLAGYAARRLTDRETVLNEVGAVGESVDEALSRLIVQMNADTESVNASAAAIGTITAGAGNVGNGSVLASLVLDGFSSPGQRAGVGFPSHRLYRGLTSELAIAEPHAVRCVADSYADRLNEGEEAFVWEGRIADVQHGVEAAEGSGSIAGIVGIHANTTRYVTNPDFEDFTDGVPDGWTLDDGTAETHVDEAADPYHGAKSLVFTGDGLETAIQVSQAIPLTSLNAGQRYVFTARIKASATIAAGALTIQFEGTGYTAGSGEKIEVAAGSLPTSWTLVHFFVNMPVSFPDDFKLVIKWTGTPTDTKSLWIDDIGFDAVTFGAGLGLIVVRGSTPFVRGDVFTFATTNTEGVVQKFFRQVFGVQLPSNGGGTETIADSVAS